MDKKIERIIQALDDADWLDWDAPGKPTYDERSQVGEIIERVLSEESE